MSNFANEIKRQDSQLEVPSHINNVLSKGFNNLCHSEIVDFCAGALAEHFFNKDFFSKTEKKQYADLMQKKLHATSAFGNDLTYEESQILKAACNDRDWINIISCLPSAVSQQIKQYQLIGIDKDLFYQPIVSQAYFTENRLPRIATANEILAALLENTSDLNSFSSITSANSYSRNLSKIEKIFLSLLPKDLEIFDINVSFDYFSAKSSASCLRDYHRTNKFALGIQQAIDQIRLSKPDQRLRVVDAGCGSIPVQSICAALLDKNLEVIAIENNPISISIAQKIVKQLGLDSRIKFVNCDATNYVPEQELDLIITETMDSGLLAEPIVQITSHLSQYLSAEGLCIPEKVSVKYAIVDKEHYENSRSFLVIGSNIVRDLEYEYHSAHEQILGQNPELIEFKLELNGLAADRTYILLLASEVDVFGEIKILPGESIITAVSDRHLEFSKSNLFSVGQVSEINVSYIPGGKAKIVST